MDYVLIPKWIEDISNINSKTVNRFLLGVDVVDNKIDMQFIRDYYRTNSSMFNLLVTELALRGFTFHSAKSNNVLPKFTVDEDEEYIRVKENKALYKCIDFELFDIGNFISRFGVEDDNFFNLIPLKGFEYLNPTIDLKLLKENLLSIGYKICKLGVVEENEVEPEDKLIEDNINVVNDGLIEELIKLMNKIGHETALSFIEKVTDKNFDGKYSLLPFFNLLNSKENRYKKVRIDAIFYENSYNKFVEFCSDRKIEYCSDLTKDLLEKFRNYKGVGISKFNKIIEILEGYVDSKEKEVANFEKHKNDRISIKESFYNIFKDVSLTVLLTLYPLGVPHEIKNLKIKEINDKTLGELATVNNYSYVIKMVSDLNSILLPEQMLNIFMTEPKNKNTIDILKLRFSLGKTLNEIGDVLNVSRERVRQKQEKGLDQINHIFDNTKLIGILKIITGGTLLFTKEQVLRVIGETNVLILDIIEKNEVSGLYHAGQIQMYSFETKDFFEGIKEKLVSILPEVFNFENYYEVVKDILYKELEEELETEIILNLLDFFGYIQYGDILSLTRLTISDILEILFKYYLDEPIYLDDQGYEKLNKIAKQELNYNFNSSLRAIDTRIRDVENIVLIDNKTFLHLNKISYNEGLIHEIDDYLEDIKLEHDVVNIEAIYDAFYDKLGNLQKYSKYALYSIIKIHLGEKYKVGGGNTLDIYLDKSNGRITREMKIINYVREHGGIVKKKDILTDFEWKAYKLDDSIGKSKLIMSWGREYIRIVEDIIVSHSIKEQFGKVLSTLMKDGYTTSKLVLDESIFFGDLGKFIAENDLNDKDKINGFLKCIFDDLRGNIVLIYNSKSKFTNINDVICDRYPKIISRMELSSFLENLGYADMIAASIFDTLIKEGRYIEISNVEAVSADRFIVEKEFAEELLNEINNRIGDKEYISLSNLEGIRRSLPATRFRLNPNFYRSVLLQNGFKSIIKFNSDYRYDKVIVVKETSKIETFEDLVYHIIDTEYSGNMHESRIYDFLTDSGIVKEQEFLGNKKLPAGIFRHDNIEIDELGIVKLVGGR